MTARASALVLLSLGALSCGKVPIYGVQAGFTLADASWFAEEETLFIFYQVNAEQGLREPSVIEIKYATDDERIGWTPIEELPKVHTHLAVDCGIDSLCGSTSLHLPIAPREVEIRLRYHRDGDLALFADTVFNVVGLGEPHSQRSLIVYGVFEETNQRVQWRGRHQFPTVRNERAQALGLRREILIQNQSYGTVGQGQADNPYKYGVECPDTFVASNLPELWTDKRAAFNNDELPVAASDASAVCADATVTDAKGLFTTGAVGRKNPEVRSAFPVLRSPIRDATKIEFFLAPCDEVISPPHENMQLQRLLFENQPVYCIDDWQQPGFVDSLVVAMRDAVEAERPAGNDMVLVIGLHQDDLGVSEAVEEALAQVVPGERHRSSPRLTGAFVFDSTDHGLTDPDLASATLWCPATINFDEIPDASVRSCALAPDIPDLELGPFSFGALPILPTREQYLDFIDTYSKAQAGEVTALTFLAPEFPAISDHVDLDEYGVVTFLNGENFPAEADDAFSYCVPEEPEIFVVRSDLMQSPAFANTLLQACYYGLVPYDLCAYSGLGLLPIELLPDWHNLVGESNYEVGLFWDFPFLLRLEYRAVLAGAVSALGFSVPFGIGSPEESYYGTDLWQKNEFSIKSLTQCDRFCDHPTFDSAGVYHISDSFRDAYAHACYVPAYPVLGDSGFPIDP